MENFSDAVQHAIQGAFSKAQIQKNPEISENHLLLSFLEDSQGYFHSLVEEAGIEPESLGREVAAAVDHLPTFTEGGQQVRPSQALQRLIVDSEGFAKQMNDSYVSSDHFFLSLWKRGGEPFAAWRKKKSGL